MPVHPRPAQGKRTKAKPKRPWFGEQLDMFPRQVLVEALDPRQHIGPRTGVAALFRIRFPDDRVTHMVFRDRYGTYCAEHGRECEAVRLV